MPINNKKQLIGMSSRNLNNLRTDPRAIGRRIREMRGFDLTQAEFGKILGVGQAQLSKCEKGIGLPSIELLLRLSDYSGKTLDWIITGKG
jgi:transcriptional regulator with XRE-family HTH domain